MNKIRIAILGLGNVGRGVWKILNTNKEEILKRSGYEIEVAKILVRDASKDRGIQVPEGIVTTNPDEIFNDNTIKIVVELMGGINPAQEYILKAIRSKKHVVTANKALISTNGEELTSEAKEKGVALYYEASVAGGIPIIHGINESLTANKIEKIVGIINGTTNYILSKMTNEGLGFDEVLKEAQAKGFAEADPTSDVEAYDAMYKLGILASLSFGTQVDVNKIYREGISNISKTDIQYAKELGYSIKLLAVGKDEDNKLELRVHPALIPTSHPLSNVNDVYNAIFIKGNAVGDLMLYGKGAGELPTGSAVVSDIISVLRNASNCVETANYSGGYWDKKIMDMKDTFTRYYVRISVKDIPGVLGRITTIFGENEVSLSSVIQKEKKEGLVQIVLLTHDTHEGNINNAIEKIEELSSVEKIENIIRVEEF